MYGSIKKYLQDEIEEIKEAGLYKSERIITSSQDAVSLKFLRERKSSIFVQIIT